jgi:undecaprenyl pyrophosphate phosphatase UppP
VQQIDVPKLFAGCFGLAGFAVAIIAGLAVDNTIEAILAKAIISLIACSTLGIILGLASEAALRDADEPADQQNTQAIQTNFSQHAQAPAESGQAA